VTPRSPDVTSLDFFLYVCVKDQVYSQRVNTLDEHKSLQQLQMLRRTCYRASGKRWTAGGVCAELQMVLTVKCFAPNNFLICK
jgi:hypothetical protein